MRQLQENLRNGEIGCLYLLLGEEAFLRGRATAALCEAIAGDENKDLGLAYERLDLGETSLAEVVDVARALPLFLPAADHPSENVPAAR